MAGCAAYGCKNSSCRRAWSYFSLFHRYNPENLSRTVRISLGSRNILSCWIRTFLLLFVITLIWLQVAFGNLFWIKKVTENPTSKHISDGKVISINNYSYEEEKLGENKIHIKSENSLNIDSAPIAIREKIRKYNEEQNIKNAEIYGPLFNDSLIIVVQVHNRLNYLKYLIESLSKAKEINEVLLVFSHDVYEEDVNRLIQSITFCKVMQIFLPYSKQAYPHEFPGDDPNDCPRDMKQQKALEIKCNGAEHPDKYHHYRESKFTQIKHHWWWKANHIFNHLQVTKGFSGLVTFLEEDHYVAEDFIYLLKAMDQKCAQIADCHFLGLGSSAKLDRVFKEADQVTMSNLITNLGLAFNRTTFNTILSCSKQFCEYDDYNWDWSLNHVTQICSKTPLRSMISGGPRVFHTGECGTHIHKDNCKEDAILSKIQGLLNTAQEKLYPPVITINDSPGVRSTLVPNGGWGDTRDQELCINMAKR